METDEIRARLSNIEKKVDMISSLLTMIIDEGRGSSGEEFYEEVENTKEVIPDDEHIMGQEEQQVKERKDDHEGTGEFRVKRK